MEMEANACVARAYSNGVSRRHGLERRNGRRVAGAEGWGEAQITYSSSFPIQARIWSSDIRMTHIQSVLGLQLRVLIGAHVHGVGQARTRR
eukprot:CAMPEP_0174373336 /NCGR_PEP_ID=MMETSP0811_2-20130205/106708_1 /TAXON_ID=73025 ORGANISM="Eutreptiella gymnastica-like, Strain CCMP1594" /NCGR_SAMPLE_ID=MMETSP0811_2 /ASSEMBLY_ACC=CAM_ASM_000667 /LENGTH=90 /DNA_ID=CAMNT_0015521557 /DNA_START=286 /DNA_END=558 /DNA_ORIENTATION=-